MTTKKLDKGYFGDGIYFTQYPSYGDYYIGERKKMKRVTEEYPLILSWIVLGNVYPV